MDEENGIYSVVVLVVLNGVEVMAKFKLCGKVVKLRRVSDGVMAMMVLRCEFGKEYA